VTFASTSDSKTYGTNDTAAVASDYSVSGLQAAVTTRFSVIRTRRPSAERRPFTSSGSAASAQVSGGPYAINVAQGTLAELTVMLWPTVRQGS